MLIEGLGSTSVANGLVRIEVLYRDAKGEDIRGEDLVIPLNRIQIVADTLEALVKKLDQAIAAGPAQSTELN